MNNPEGYKYKFDKVKENNNLLKRLHGANLKYITTGFKENLLLRYNELNLIELVDITRN